MFVVDTNVLARILIDEPNATAQVKLARQFAKKQTKLLVTQIVQVELIWVLIGAYELDKSDVIKILEHLSNNEAFHLQKTDEFLSALYLFKNVTADFSDCLIWAESRQGDYTIITFDKKFSKLPHVKLLTE